MREEFNVQRAKMKELFLQKEGKTIIHISKYNRNKLYKYGICRRIKKKITR